LSIARYSSSIPTDNNRVLGWICVFVCLREKEREKSNMIRSIWKILNNNESFVQPVEEASISKRFNRSHLEYISVEHCRCFLFIHAVFIIVYVAFCTIVLYNIFMIIDRIQKTIELCLMNFRLLKWWTIETSNFFRDLIVVLINAWEQN
jgi:hypothetical protein